MNLTAEQDERVMSLLEELLTDVRNGDRSRLNEVCQEHPELAAELRGLWATAQLADDIGSLAATIVPVPPQEAQPALALPREAGDFVLLEELGRGGMGVVYRAFQKSLQRVVALKMILRGGFASQSDIERFRVGAELAGRLNHPQIVPIYEFGELEGQPFFTMKLVEGVTLARMISEGPITARQAAEYMIPVCRAIQDSHDRQILHRDLKPSNIIVDDEGHTYVTDFGLAKSLALDGSDTSPSLTQSGAILGTPGYMAPEQAAGNRGLVGPAADIYSLGAVLYALLTGRPPFQASTPVDTVLLLLEQDPVPPRALNSKIDSDLEMIVMKCLQKPIELRYATAGLLADDLQAYLNSEPVQARSSHLSHVISRAFRETHHAAILENWGLLWMWHSVVVLCLCVITNVMQFSGVNERWPYVALWSVGVGTWAAIFWELRRRSGPITFVERQIAHVWAASTICSTLLFALEFLLDLPALALSPVLSLVAGGVFVVKAGILSGTFYLQSAALFLTAFLMASLQRNPSMNFGLTLFGVVLAICFFVPGLKYYRQRIAGQRG